MRFKIYQFEVQQIIDKVVEKKSKLILATAPVNLQAPPRKVCSNASTPPLEQKLASLDKHLESGKSKQVITELSKLKGIVLGHARFHHLLGRAYYRQGEFKQAKEYLSKANSFDCAPNGSSHILNNILRRKARENAVTLLDLDEKSNAHLGKNAIFNRDHYSRYPQDKYYHHFLEQLATIINRSLSAKTGGSL